MNPWEQRYQSAQTGWDRGGISPALKYWLDEGLSPCRILIPGCGRGHEVVELAKRGFIVTAIDIAPSAVQHLNAALDAAGVSATVVQGDLFRLHPHHPFDAVYEQTCLCAIEPGQRQAYAEKLYGWLRPGGHLYALLMQTGVTGGPPFHCDLLAMRELFCPPRWQWPEGEQPVFTPHRNGRFELGYCLIRQPEV